MVVDEQPEFNTTTEEVYKKLEAAGIHLLRAIAVYLNLPENYFDDKVTTAIRYCVRCIISL
jgi:isopenicillin N synthase-like dioxygenase